MKARHANGALEVDKALLELLMRSFLGLFQVTNLSKVQIVLIWTLVTKGSKLTVLTFGFNDLTISYFLDESALLTKSVQVSTVIKVIAKGET